MPHVAFTPHLRRFFPSLADGQIEGSTVREVIEALDRRYPGLATYLVDETGRLRRHVNVFVDQEQVRDRERLGDRLEPASRVFILQALTGG